MDQFSSTRNTDNDAIRGEIIPPEEDTEDTADTAGTTPQSGYPQTYLHKVATARPGDDTEEAEGETPADALAEDRDGALAEESRDEAPAAGDDTSTIADTTDERETEPVSVAEVPAATTAPGLIPAPDLIPPGAALLVEEQRERDRAAEADAVPEVAVPDSGAGVPAPQGRRPGDEPIPPSLEDSLLPGGSGTREEWLRIQAQFVDDPRMAVSEAASIVADMASRLQAAVRERQDNLRTRWDGDSKADTESLRVTMQQYRHLLERLAGL